MILNVVEQYKESEKLGWWASVFQTDDSEIAQMVNSFVQKNLNNGDNYFFLHQEAILLGCLLTLLRACPQESQTAIKDLLAFCSKEQLEEKFTKAYQAGKINYTVYDLWKIVSSNKVFDCTVMGLWSKIV